MRWGYTTERNKIEMIRQSVIVKFIQSQGLTVAYAGVFRHQYYFFALLYCYHCLFWGGIIIVFLSFAFITYTYRHTKIELVGFPIWLCDPITGSTIKILNTHIWIFYEWFYDRNNPKIKNGI